MNNELAYRRMYHDTTTARHRRHSVEQSGLERSVHGAKRNARMSLGITRISPHSSALLTSWRLGTNMMSELEMNRDASHPPRRLFRFLRIEIGSLDIWWASIPTFFIALKYAQISLVGVTIADSIVGWLSKYWPVLPQQYSKIIEAASDVERCNYGPFLLTALLFGLVGIFRATIQYIKEDSNIEVSRQDVVVSLFLIVVVSLTPWFDQVKARPRLGWDFYVDSFGLYYFRQTLFPYGLSYAVIIFVILVGRAAKTLFYYRSSR